ncbi:MAG: GNAT family N-acetyltransferase [Chloroflexi bacterium]|nr:GNAT family N-acetyltransferase [Chloroflexota bacterium]
MTENPKSMNTHIRRAEPADAPGITRIIRAAWQEYNPDVFPNVIPKHMTFVAERGEAGIIGFVDSFATQRDEDDAEIRWEVDWLAVDPKNHGHGTGTALIAAATEAGRAAHATVARALVRIGNVASEKAFEKNGYKPSPDMLALYISDQPLKELRSVADHRQSYLITVNRLNDTAIWIEGEITDRVLQQARYVIGVRGWHAAGALIPRSDRKLLKLVEAEGYKHVANYRQYVLRY